jgi:hypothetical protein
MGTVCFTEIMASTDKSAQNLAQYKDRNFMEPCPVQKPKVYGNLPSTKTGILWNLAQYKDR